MPEKSRVQHILLVDDDEALRRSLSDLLREQGRTILAVSSILQARQALAADAFDMILCDLRLDDGNGLDLLRDVREKYPQMPAILMTGYPTVETAIDSLRIGLADYLMKPIFPAMLDSAIGKIESGQVPVMPSREPVKAEPKHEVAFNPVWGTSRVMREIVELIEKVAQTESTVLITGESGTGKELIAQSIWQSSERNHKPFIKVNCAAVTETLLESEFFGHEKGAFTGALHQRQGRFEVANNGTLLLDEIAEIPMSTQVKLLRVLQEQEFERVGGNTSIKVDVRIIAATNRELMKEVKEGRFREDLFYRLNVLPIHLPPLRQRGEDLDMLAAHFLEMFARRHDIPFRPLSDKARTQLQTHSWPGNVRELQNAIERSVIMSSPESNIIEEIDFGPRADRDRDGSSPLVLRTGAPPSMADMERHLIGVMLIHTKNNRTRASEKLGISLRTLRNKLAQYRKEGYDTSRPEKWA